MHATQERHAVTQPRVTHPRVTHPRVTHPRANYRATQHTTPSQRVAHNLCLSLRADITDAVQAATWHAWDTHGAYLTLAYASDAQPSIAIATRYSTACALGYDYAVIVEAAPSAHEQYHHVTPCATLSAVIATLASLARSAGYTPDTLTLDAPVWRGVFL